MIGSGQTRMTEFEKVMKFFKKINKSEKAMKFLKKEFEKAMEVYNM